MNSIVRGILTLALVAVLVAGSFVLGLHQYLALSDSCTLFRQFEWTLFPLLVVALALVWRRIVSSPRRSAVFPRLTMWSVVLLVVGSWIASWAAGPSLLGAIDRGRQKRTMADIRALGAAIERSRDETASFPPSGEATDLALFKNRGLSTTDAWGEPLKLQVADNHYYVISYARCSRPDVPSVDGYSYGPTISFDADIVLKDGQFLRWPEGVQY